MARFKGANNPMSEDARRLKEYLQPCMDLPQKIDDIDTELDTYEGLGLTDTEEALREQRRELFSTLCRYRNEVFDLIRDTPTLTGDERMVLRLRLLRAISWSNIALTMSRSKSVCLYHYRNAINKIAEHHTAK